MGRHPDRSDRQLILVVDDQKFMREVARDWLQEAGFSVEEAENGKEALEVFETKGKTCCKIGGADGT